jgi:hypothetical protein
MWKSSDITDREGKTVEDGMRAARRDNEII